MLSCSSSLMRVIAVIALGLNCNWEVPSFVFYFLSFNCSWNEADGLRTPPSLLSLTPNQGWGILQSET